MFEASDSKNIVYRAYLPNPTGKTNNSKYSEFMIFQKNGSLFFLRVLQKHFDIISHTHKSFKQIEHELQSHESADQEI